MLSWMLTPYALIMHRAGAGQGGALCSAPPRPDALTTLQALLSSANCFVPAPAATPA